MARRLVNTTIKNHKDEFVFEIWDMVSGAPDKDYTCEFDVNGFTIDWDSGSDDKNEIVGSSCNWTMYFTEEQRTFVMEAAYAAEEFRLCVRIMKGGSPWWCGIVHSENIVEEIGDGIITVSFSASDGLGILDNYDYKQEDGTKYSGFTTVAELLWNALRKLPHTSLYALTGYEVLREWPIPRPVTPGSGELWSTIATNGNKYGTLNYMQADPATFYRSSQQQEHSMFTDKVMSIERYRPNKHTSSKKVIQDIMASLGSSICFAEGRWNVFDRKEHIIDGTTAPIVIANYATQTGDLDPDRDQLGSAENTVYDRNALAETGSNAAFNQPLLAFRRGASRKGLYPYSGATQKHDNAGSDLLYANGIGYAANSGRFDRTNPFGEPGFNQPLFRFKRFGRSGTVPLSADTFENTDTQYLWIDREFPEPDSSVNKDRTLDGMYELNDREGLIEEIDLPGSANDGQIRLHMSGDIQYTDKNLQLSGQPDAEANLMIYKTRVEAYDGTQWLRLNRPVRTLRYDSNGDDADINISGSGRYHIKFWTGVYEWVSPASDRYADSWLDIPLGANEGILEQGAATKFMQTDYPALDVYTPPLTKLNGSSDNELTTDDSSDRSFYVWRHDHIYDLPNVSSITKLRLMTPVIEEWAAQSGPNMLYNSSGTELSIGTNDGNPIYRTTNSEASFNTGMGHRPNSVVDMQFSGAEIFYGDGEGEFDSTSVCIPDTVNGKEIANLTTTRLGATFNNSGKATFGRYTASDFFSPSYQEDNLKFVRQGDTSFKKNSLGALVTNNVMQVRGVTRQLISGELFQPHDSSGGSSILYPYQQLFMRGLEATTQRIVPTSLSYSLLESSQQLEGFISSVGAESNIAVTDEVYNDNMRGPDRKPTLSKPDTSDLSDFVAVGSQTGGTGGGTTGTGGKFGDLFPMFIRRL